MLASVPRDTDQRERALGPAEFISVIPSVHKDQLDRMSRWVTYHFNYTRALLGSQSAEGHKAQPLPSLTFMASTLEASWEEPRRRRK